MKHFLLMLFIALAFQTDKSYGSTVPLNAKNNNAGIELPSYKILKVQYGIRLKWHQRIKYGILKLNSDRLIQDDDKKIKRAKIVGIASLIAGISGLIILYFAPGAGLILAVVAIIGGLVSRKRNPKKGISNAAVIIGLSTITLALLAVALFVAGI